MAEAPRTPSRRDFMKTSAAVVGGTLASSFALPGAYAAGSDPLLDEAIRQQGAMSAFLQQDMHEAAPLDASVGAMARSLGY